MKVPSDSYQNFKNSFRDLMPQMDQMRASIAEEGKARDPEKRLRWDCLWKAVPSEEIIHLYNEHGCNDEHIDTALRSVMRDLAIEKLVASEPYKVAPSPRF